MRRITAVLVALVMTASSLMLLTVAAPAASAGWTKLADGGLGNPANVMMFPYKEFGGKLFFSSPKVASNPPPYRSGPTMGRILPRPRLTVSVTPTTSA